MFIFYIPLAIIGIHLGGLKGLFVGLCLANLGTGVLSLILERVLIRNNY